MIERLLPALGLLMAATVVIWTVWRFIRGDFDAREHLPLDLCNLSALLSALHSSASLGALDTWMVCVAAPGAAVGILTPDLDGRHGLSTHIKYWIVHGGLVAYGIGAALIAAEPAAPLLFATWLALLLYALAVFVLNFALRANYCYLLRKPATYSVLDHLGPWPFYLAPMIGIVLAATSISFVGWAWIVSSVG